MGIQIETAPSDIRYASGRATQLLGIATREAAVAGLVGTLTRVMSHGSLHQQGNAPPSMDACHGVSLEPPRAQVAGIYTGVMPSPLPPGLPPPSNRMLLVRGQLGGGRRYSELQRFPRDEYSGPPAHSLEE